MNLFIVESPFQLLSAIEANNYFKHEKNILIIKYSAEEGNEKNNEQLRILKIFSNWNQIFELTHQTSTKSVNNKLWLFIKTIHKNYKGIDKIFIGEYRNWIMREYFNILNPKRCFVLDDGNITIELAKSYIPMGKNYELARTWKTPFREFIINLFRFYVASKVIPKRVDINLFTCFDVESYFTQETIIKHSFEYLKSKNKSKQVLENIVYFFGGNLSESKLMARENELNELRNVKKYFDKRNIQLIYLPHRRESQEKLEMIEKDLKIEIRYSTYPAEIEFVLLEAVPQYLGSFMSTALYTVSKIIDFKEVIAFELPYKKINPIYLNDIVSTYEDYRKNINVVKFNELD